MVNRDFASRGARKVLLTDITYLFYAGWRCYLSTILDAVTHEILAWQVSESLEVQFVLDTVDALLDLHGATLDNMTIVHSDQGCHYTSRAFIAKLKDAAFVQSMSRKGNCIDNAATEQVFGHLKDEFHAGREFASYEQFKNELDAYIIHWNTKRRQIRLEGHTPEEFRNMSLTA